MRHSPLLFTVFAKIGFASLFMLLTVGVLNSLAVQWLGVDLSAFVQALIRTSIESGNGQIKAIVALLVIQCLIVGLAYCGPTVVRWVLSRRIAIIASVLVLTSVDYRLGLLAISGAFFVFFLLKAIYVWLPTSRMSHDNFNHMSLVRRVFNTLGFAVLVVGLLYSPHMKIDLVHQLYVLLESTTAVTWIVLAICPALIFGVLCYQLGNRFFPLVLSSKWAIGVFVVSLIASFVTMRSLFIIGLVAGIFIVAFVLLEFLIPQAGGKRNKRSSNGAFLPWGNQMTHDPLERTWNPSHPTHLK
ncbi:hypothetical protein [Eoetvoesiella caeni]